MNLENIKKIIEPALATEKLSLFSLKTKQEFGMNILEVLVDGDKLDSDTLSTVNQKINDLIDSELPEDYYLEVSSPGAERDIRSLEEANRFIGKYVFFKTKNLEHEGTLEKITGETLSIKVNLKGRFKTFEINYSDIIKLRLAIKF